MKINILDFKYLKNDRFHNAYRLKELETNEELTDTIEIHFVEIPKLRKIDDTEEITDMLTAWIEFISNLESEIVSRLEMSREEIKEAKEELIKLSADSILIDKMTEYIKNMGISMKFTDKRYIKNNFMR